MATLSQPCCISGAIYKLELHKFGTGLFFFFFLWLYQISEKREQELSLGHPVCGFFICAGSLHLDGEAVTGSGARDHSGCGARDELAVGKAGQSYL